ncbi:MAG: hypothetical protein ACYC9L_05490 [Sulfuricaulis sp.]
MSDLIAELARLEKKLEMQAEEINRLKAAPARVDGGLSSIASRAQHERASQATLAAGGNVSAPELDGTARAAADYAFADWYPNG